MTKKDDIIKFSQEDISQGEALLQNIDENVIPHLYDPTTGKKSEIGDDERAVLKAIALLQLAPEATKDGEYTVVEAFPGDVAIIVQAVQRYEETKNSHILGAMVSLIKNGRLATFGEYIKALKP